MNAPPLVLVVGAETIRDLDPPAPGTWDWGFAAGILPFLLEGLVVTIQATAVGITIAMVLGLALAILRRARLLVVRWPATAFVEFVRSTPLLVQLFFWFIAFPDVTGITLSPLRTGILALGIHYATYTSEAYRAGIEGVRRGQWEAATAINLSAPQTWRHIVLPQAVPSVIPALGNYLVAMLKDAPLLSAITVVELLAQARQIQGIWFRGLEPFTMVGLLFLTVSIPASIFVRFLEKRYGYQRG